MPTSVLSGKKHFCTERDTLAIDGNLRKYTRTNFTDTFTFPGVPMTYKGYCNEAVTLGTGLGFLSYMSTMY